MIRYTKDMKQTLLIFLIISLESCYEYRQLPNSVILDKYKGLSEHQILLDWGPATRTTSDGNGGKILEYKKESDPTTVTGLYEDVSHHVYTVAQTHSNEWYVQFYINKNDSVYTYRSNISGPVEKIKINNPSGPPPPHNPLNLFKKKKDTTKKSN
jgi:hypothetical protein